MTSNSHNYLAKHPSLSLGSNPGKKLWLADMLIPVLPSRKNIRILEIGPGNGEALSLLVNDIGYTNVEGIDISADVIEVCAKIIGSSMRLVTDTIDFLKDNKQSYDVVLMYHVLEHFKYDDVIPTLSAIYDALNADGLLIVGVPNAAAPIIGSEQQYFDFTHRVGFSPWSLEQAHRMAGFEKCEVKEMWPPKKGIVKILQRTIQKLVISIVKGYLFVIVPHKRKVITHNMVCYAYKNYSDSKQ
jgi:2-polyprenyl-3-methyl-5-hydroxy-6-metoxy-1,4-benzoquinol methylase